VTGSAPPAGTGTAAGRRVATVEVVPPLGPPRRAAAWAGLLLAGHAALAAAALLTSPAGALAAVAVVAVAEVGTGRRVPRAGWALSRTGLGAAARTAVRGVLLALAAVDAGRAAVAAVAVAVVLLVVLEVLRTGAAQVVEVLRAPPVLSRGLRLDLPGMPRAPAALLRDPRGVQALLEVPVAAGAVLAAHGRPGAGAAVQAVAVLAAALAAAALAGHALRLHRAGVRTRVAEQVQRALDLLRPQVLLYFGGDASWRYQVEMWLEPVERLGRPAVVVVRDRDVLAALAPTSLPVVCVPNGSALTALELPDARVSLFVANTGDALHLLRRRDTRSAFIGHGDSDKGASANPLTRVYDEVWVAGPAGRQRWRDSGVALPDDRVVEVGRPQVDVPSAPPAVPGGALTVLYAPTWEGWGDDPFASSLAHTGPDLVRQLLARPGVRVLYRPHPLSGSRDPAVRRGAAQVLALLRGAGAVGPEQAPLPVAPDAAGGGDVLDLALASGEHPWSREEHARVLRAWTARWWDAAPAAHRLLVPPAPGLADSFAAADVLVTDVSSVATEWLRTGRPYAVVDGRGRPPQEFRDAYPSAAAAVVLGPGLDDLDALLEAGRGGPDPLAAARRGARAHLLGPAGDDPVAGLRAAVDRLCGLPAPTPPGAP